MKKIFVLMLLILVTVTTVNAAPTKTVAQIDEWAAVAQNGFREGATYDVSGAYAAILHIDMALTSENVAHTGTRIVVQTSSNTTGDEDWTVLSTWIGPTGTGQCQALAGAESATDTVIEIADTTGFVTFDAAGSPHEVFILDNAVATSEPATQYTVVASTSITLVDGLTNAHDASDSVCSIMRTYPVQLPLAANRVRVYYDNTYDVNGSAVHTRTRITLTTGL